MESDSLWRRCKPRELMGEKKRLKSNIIFSSELYNHICCRSKPDCECCPASESTRYPSSLAAISDDLTFSLLDTKAVFCMINSNQKMSDPGDAEEVHRYNTGTGVLRRFYEEQARYKMYRIPVFRPPPAFVVYLKHLDDRLKNELANLDRESKDFVMKEAISRICEQVDKRFFLLSVKPLLKWRLEN
jgi:hypothetical protein